MALNFTLLSYLEKEIYIILNTTDVNYRRYNTVFMKISGNNCPILSIVWMRKVYPEVQ